MEKQTAKKEHGGVFGQGEPNVNYAQYFVGNSYLKPLTDPKETNIFMANVTFEPKCRNQLAYTPCHKRWEDKF